jgi:hypothetical protein
MNVNGWVHKATLTPWPFSDLLCIFRTTQNSSYNTGNSELCYDIIYILLSSNFVVIIITAYSRQRKAAGFKRMVYEHWSRHSTGAIRRRTNEGEQNVSSMCFIKSTGKLCGKYVNFCLIPMVSELFALMTTLHKIPIWSRCILCTQHSFGLTKTMALYWYKQSAVPEIAGAMNVPYVKNTQQW